jgi:hypothetical protein
LKSGSKIGTVRFEKCFLNIIHKIIVAITREGHIPDLLKTGLLTPIFKNKGSKLHVANYRGITVTPVV